MRLLLELHKTDVCYLGGEPTFSSTPAIGTSGLCLTGVWHEQTGGRFFPEGQVRRCSLAENGQAYKEAASQFPMNSLTRECLCDLFCQRTGFRIAPHRNGISIEKARRAGPQRNAFPVQGHSRRISYLRAQSQSRDRC